MIQRLSIAIFFLLSFSFQGAKASDLPADSLYQIDSKWVTQDGTEMELRDLRGKPTILSMVYLSCKFICPTVVSEVQAIEGKLDQKMRDQVQVVIVSFDPARDLPEAMKSYATGRKLDLSRWKFITNKNDSRIRELAVASNFKYRKNDNGEFTHSYMILLLDQNGSIKERLDGTNQDHKPMLDAIRMLLGPKK